jgi:type IV secretory pathway VirB9-like protein
MDTLSPDGPSSKIEKVYAFQPGQAYRVDVPLGVPADVVLQPGEQIRNIAGGDRAPADPQEPPRWQVKEGASGEGKTARPHVFLTASTPGLAMGLAITTNKHIYYLDCRSVGKTPIRAVRWTYPAEPPPPAKPPVVAILPDPA